MSYRQVDTLQPYIPAGNKYHFYRIASTRPDYAEMRYDFFYYNFCYKRNSSTTQTTSQSIAFGQVSAEYDVRVPRDNPEVYMEVVPRNPQNRNDILREYVTLTDNKSFVFVTLCWTGVDQRAWLVFSSKPTLDPVSEHLILEHAVSLGFKKENALFIRYHSCKAANPLLTNTSVEHEKRSNIVKKVERNDKPLIGSYLTSVRAYGDLDHVKGNILGRRG